MQFGWVLLPPGHIKKQVGYTTPCWIVTGRMSMKGRGPDTKTAYAEGFKSLLKVVSTLQNHLFVCVAAEDSPEPRELLSILFGTLLHEFHLPTQMFSQD